MISAPLVRLAVTFVTIAWVSGCALYPGPYAPKYLELNVSGDAQTLCMRAEHRGETFVPWVMSISELTGDRSYDIWSEVIPDQEQRGVASGKCIPSSSDNPFPQLQPGVAYEAFVRNGVSPARFFTAYFCLVGDSRPFRVHQLRDGGRRDWSQCRLERTPAY